MYRSSIQCLMTSYIAAQPDSHVPYIAAQPDSHAPYTAALILSMFPIKSAVVRVTSVAVYATIYRQQIKVKRSCFESSNCYMYVYVEAKYLSHQTLKSCML